MKRREINAALGKEKAQLVFKNATVADVFLRRFTTSDVAVENGVIVGLGEYDGKKEIDCTGRYLMPSFVESHVHIESSMLCPGEYAKIAAAQGVTAIIADPHEIANVCGEKGLRFMLEAAKGVPVDFYFMLPSCVPATPFDHSGAVIDGKKTKELFENYPFWGLGEMMNVPGVLEMDEEVHRKLGCTTMIDGHAPGLCGKELNAFCCAGVRTDHECVTAQEALEKISRGLYVEIREGSQSRNLAALAPAITPDTLRRLLLCTDDRYLGDVMEYGSISNCVRRAVACGVAPIDAIIMATLNACECYHLEGRGAVAPGYRADLLLSGDPAGMDIAAVYKDGVLIAQKGQPCFSAPPLRYLEEVSHTVHCAPVSANQFSFAFDERRPVIGVHPQTLITTKEYCSSPEGLNLCAVLERHRGAGTIGMAFAKGFELKEGAIAQTIGHDSHNITVLGAGAEDMALAVNALGREGGMAVARGGKVLAVLELPVAGLMSPKDASSVLAEHKAVLRALEQLEFNRELEPFMMLSFLSLLVIPELKLSDNGLFDVSSFSFVK